MPLFSKGAGVVRAQAAIIKTAPSAHNAFGLSAPSASDKRTRRGIADGGSLSGSLGILQRPPDSLWRCGHIEINDSPFRKSVGNRA